MPWVPAAGFFWLGSSASFAASEAPTGTSIRPAIPETQGVSPLPAAWPKLVPGFLRYRAGRHQPRIEAKSWTTPFKPDIRAAADSAGATERAAAARDGRAEYRRSQINLPSRLDFGGLQIPASIGPFSYFDARLTVTQSFRWKRLMLLAASKLKSRIYV